MGSEILLEGKISSDASSMLIRECVCMAAWSPFKLNSCYSIIVKKNRPLTRQSAVTEWRALFKEMLINGILPIISSQKQKRRFSFAYKPTTCVVDLAARPWAAWKR